MKRARKIAKIIQGRRVVLHAGRWYVASIPLGMLGPRKPDADPFTVSIRPKRNPLSRPVFQVHNLTRQGAFDFMNAFNTSGPLSFCGRKWPTRTKRTKRRAKWRPWHSPMLVWPNHR